MLYTTDIKMLLGQIFITIVCCLFIIGAVCIIIDFITEPPRMSIKEYNEMMALKMLKEEPSVMFDDLELGSDISYE